MTFISHLEGPVENWGLGGVPLSSLLHLEIRKGTPKPVIQKALVSCKDAPFKLLEENREKWAIEDNYLSIGPMQFNEEMPIPHTLSLEKKSS